MTDVQRPLWRRFLVFLLPLMLSNVLQSLSGRSTRSISASMIGVDALAAVGGVFPDHVLSDLRSSIGLASGSTVLIGQAWGAQESNKVKEMAGTTITATFILGLVVAVIGSSFHPADPDAVLGAPANMLEQSVTLWPDRADRHAGLFHLPHHDLDAARRRRHDDAADRAGAVDPRRPGGHAGVDPGLGRTAEAGRRGGARWRSSSASSWCWCSCSSSCRARKKPAGARRGADPASAAQFPLLGLSSSSACRRACRWWSRRSRRSSSSASSTASARTRRRPMARSRQVLSYVQFPAMSIDIAASIFGAQAIGAGAGRELPAHRAHRADHEPRRHRRAGAHRLHLLAVAGRRCSSPIRRSWR